MDRPDWDQYFMTLAFLVSQRSLDEQTKHGTIVVNDEHTILATGYNSPPRGCFDEEIPKTRPEKYLYFAHSEVSAITNAAREGVSLKDSTFYVTGLPCEVCIKYIINCGAKQIYYGHVISNCVDNKDRLSLYEEFTKYNGVQLSEYTESKKIIELLNKTLEYTKSREI